MKKRGITGLISTILLTMLMSAVVYGGNIAHFSDRNSQYRQYRKAVNKLYNYVVTGKTYTRRDPTTGYPVNDTSGNVIHDTSNMLWYRASFYSSDIRNTKREDITANEEDIYTVKDALHVGEADHAGSALHTVEADYAATAQYSGYAPGNVTTVQYIPHAVSTSKALVGTNIDYGNCPAGKIDTNRDTIIPVSTNRSPKCDYIGSGINIHAKQIVQGRVTAGIYLENNNTIPRQFRYKKHTEQGWEYQYAARAYHADKLVPFLYDASGNPYPSARGTAYLGKAPKTISAGAYNTVDTYYSKGNRYISRTYTK